MAQAEHEKKFDVSADQYYQVITQYEKYSEFVDGMKRVTVERAGDKIIGHYELSMMSKDMSYDLSIFENPKDKIVSWTLLKSDFFKVNNGKWTIQALGDHQCQVRYSLEVDFNFSVPGFLLRGLVKGTLPTMMNSFYERAKQ